MWPAYLVCGGWHVACLLSMCGWSGLPRSQGCGPAIGSSGSPGWLLAFGLVCGVVEGLGGGRGPGEYNNAGRNGLLQVQVWVCLTPALWQTWGFPGLQLIWD